MREEKEAIFLLTSTDTERFKVARRSAATVVGGKDWQWIVDDCLYVVMLRIWGLLVYDKNLVTGECMALLTRRLLKHESQVGGPYRDDHGRLDILTNCAIARVFEEFGCPLPSVMQYINETVSQEDMVHYDSMTRWLLLWPAPFNDSLALDGVIGGNTRSTVLVSKDEQEGGKDIQLNNAIVSFIADNMVMQQVQKEIDSCRKSLRGDLQQQLDGVMKIDKVNGEISKLTDFFVRSHPLLDMSNHRAAMFGAANIFMWIAYTIYDDFIDEAARTMLLPIANKMHRSSLLLYRQLATSKQGEQFVSRFFDDMDEANRWELGHCRPVALTNHSISIDEIPYYGRRNMLARRAHGHIIGPALLALESKAIDKQKFRALCNGLDHYLIARQLSDDIYDWVDDLKAGHISFVVAFLMQSSGVKVGLYDVGELVTTLQRYFWDKGLERLIAMTLRHTYYARRYFLKGGVTSKDNPFFECSIVPLERTARLSREDHKNRKLFLQTLYGE